MVDRTISEWVADINENAVAEGRPTRSGVRTHDAGIEHPQPTASTAYLDYDAIETVRVAIDRLDRSRP
jgi:hypothetical protein